MLPQDIVELNERITQESIFVEKIVSEIGKVIVGQRHMIEGLLIGILSNGHVLLEGVPGLAKTLTVSTLAKTIRAKFRRIQFTPDLLPEDLMGTMVYNQKTGEFIAKRGPIFANIILADEVNRAPAKVQSAMLEAMQERQVTIGDDTYPLEEPFLVLATQNPIEQEGTYPLPEAQVDRFMLKVKVGYPSREEERIIMDRMTSGRDMEVEGVISPENLLSARAIMNMIYVDEKVKNYIIDIVFATREPEKFGLNDLTLAVETVRELNIPCGVVLNRAGVGDAGVQKYCQNENIPILLTIPLDTEIARLYSRGIPLVERYSRWRSGFRELFDRVKVLIDERSRSIKR